MYWPLELSLRYLEPVPANPRSVIVGLVGLLQTSVWKGLLYGYWQVEKNNVWNGDVDFARVPPNVDLVTVPLNRLCPLFVAKGQACSMALCRL